MLKKESLNGENEAQHIRIFSDIRWIIRLLVKGYTSEEIAALSEFCSVDEVELLRKDLESGGLTVGHFREFTGEDKSIKKNDELLKEEKENSEPEEEKQEPPVQTKGERKEEKSQKDIKKKTEANDSEEISPQVLYKEFEEIMGNLGERVQNVVDSYKKDRRPGDK